MWVWYSAGHQRSLTRPNKHDHSSGQHKEHSVSAFVPQLWLPTQVQGNGNEKLKKEPRGLGGFNLSPWVSHNGMVTKIFMHIFSPWYCTYPLINLNFSDFGVMKNWLFFQSSRICTYLKVIKWSCQAETFCRTTFRGPDSTHTPKPGALLERSKYEPPITTTHLLLKTASGSVFLWDLCHLCATNMAWNIGKNGQKSKSDQVISCIIVRRCHQRADAWMFSHHFGLNIHHCRLYWREHA